MITSKCSVHGFLSKQLDNSLMYNKNTDYDFLSAVAMASVGAGIVTTFAISQGQHPLVALGITGVAVVFALVCNRTGLI